MLRRLSLGAMATTVAWASPALASIAPPVAHAMRVPLRLSGIGGVALTFDDGPHQDGTPAVLEALAAAGASATFFLVGEQVDGNPSLAREIVASGHTVGVHGYRHRNLLRLSPRQLGHDLDRAVAAIADATGVPPTLYRPPYGIFSLVGPSIVRGRGLQPLLWSRWARDWRAGATAEGISSEVARELTAGDVLLLHDSDHYSAPGSWRATALALPEVLARIEAAGHRPVAL